MPASVPASIAPPRTGVSASREKNPVWMSRARSVPAFIVENSAPWMNGTASAKARNESVGKPGSCVDAWSPPELRSISATGKMSGGIELAGRRAVRTIERCASAPTCVAQRAHRAACSRPRRWRRPRACARSWRGRRRRASGPVARRRPPRGPRHPCARITSAMPRPSREAHGEVAFAAELLAEPLQDLRDPRPVCLLARDHVDARTADLRLQRGRRPLGDDPAVVDDPDAVGEDVGLLEVLRRQEHRHVVLAREPRDLLPERRAALRVEAGRRLVEEQDRGPVDEREREVEAALHPARVAADLAVGRLRQPDALEELVWRGLRSARGTACSIVCRRRWSRPVSSGSSAASCSAAPIDGAHLRPLLADVVASHAGGSRGRRQQRRQHQHGRRLAGAVRAEEAVDLAGSDVEVDPVDGPRALLELADELLDDDAVVAGHRFQTTDGGRLAWTGTRRRRSRPGRSARRGSGRARFADSGHTTRRGARGEIATRATARSPTSPWARASPSARRASRAQAWASTRPTTTDRDGRAWSLATSRTR